MQGRWHVRALARVRNLRRIRMWSPNRERCAHTAGQLTEELGVEVVPVPDPVAAVGDADLVIAGTLSHTPVVPTAEVAAGATVVSVGSFAPDRHEVDQALLDRADRVVVDHVPTATGHAGPIMRAVAEGVLTEGDLTSLGEVLCGTRPGRRAPSDLVVYHSVGLGVQDAAAAAWVLSRHHAAKR
ncbi:hypothetical protein M8C13_32800 [Crossiella sp. SN42]|uniref:hypothetical protein n=1 Tax=Crossiella sp. SN42 TaxID=2944808 RepID=UPI00207CFE99|nr:hypothetical protein [Crossiella sp. SN42]MCO1580545.1 hypothetical protein [Crossiella sp. SN42]